MKVIKKGKYWTLYDMENRVLFMSLNLQTVLERL